MPGNEVGDRVHNFFAQDNLSQSQHHSQVADGNRLLLNNNPWVGIQRQIDAESSKLKNYDTQQSDLERGHSSHSLQVSHGLNSTHPTLRPELAKSQSHNQHPNLNGYMYERQVFRSRPDETNFLGMDRESDQNNLITRGLSICGLSQGSGPENPTTLVRLDSLESPVSFDLFGGQQQMGSQHSGMLQSLPQQQSEFSDMQLMQKPVMIRRVQELQRQKELWQLDARQQNSVNQVPSFARQLSSNHSHALVNGTPISDASSYPWATEVTAGNTNWLQRASQAMQGSSTGLVLSPEQGQVSHSVGLVHQQVDQSLYGVPISSLRGSSNQYPHIAMDKPLQQMASYSNSFQVKQYTVPPEQVSMQDRTLISRQGFQGKNLFRHISGQGLNSGINMENLQQLNPLQRNVPVQEFQGRQEIVGPSEIVKDKTAQASSSQNSVALDPTEEKILFGSDDDSIWDAFGKSSDMSGGASNLVDGAGFSSGFPSIQSGSWSALMQSAVAETSSSDLGLQEEWTGFSFQNPDLPDGNNQPSTYNDTGKCRTSLDDSNLQITSAFSIRSDLPSDDANLKNNYRSAQGFQQFVQNISQEHDEGLHDSSKRPIHQSPAGGSNWLNRGNQTYRNDSHSADADTNEKSSSSHWTPQQSGFSQPSNKPNNWGPTELVTPCGDASFDSHESEKSMHKSHKNDQKRVMHEKLSNYDGIGNVSSIPNSAVELEQLRSTMGSPQVSREGSGLSNAAAVANSSNTGASEEASQFLPNSRHLNTWKLANSSVKSKGSDRLGKLQNPVNKGSQLVESSLNSSEKEEVKMHEIDTFNKKENLNDSYHSNLPYHTSAIGLKENVLSDASDSRTKAGGKQKSSNQVGRKTPVSRKFQYHPMGNLDEDLEPSYRAKQATHSQAMPLHNSQGSKSQEQGFFGQSKLFGHVPKSSIEMGKGQWADRERGTEGLDEVPHRGVLPGYRPSMPAPFDRSLGMMASNKASHPSQNMLELLHKVDQSKECGMGMHFSSSEHNLLSETTEAENSDGSGGRLQRSQSSASQGFGLQLAPPSQRLSVSNLVSQSPSTVNSPASNQETSDRGGEKGHIKLSSTALGQSLLSSHERSQGEFKNNRNVFPGHTSHEASLHRTQENSSAFNSGFPYSRSQLQNHLIAGAREQGSMSQLVDLPFDKHALPPKQADDSYITLTGQSAEASFPNTACSIPYDNINSYANISRPTATNCSYERAPAEKISPGEVASISQSFTATGMSQQGAFPRMLPNVWTNVPVQQQFLGAQARQVQPKLSLSHQSDIVESTSSALRNLENQDAKIMGNIPSDLGSGSVHSQGFVSGEEQLTVENPCQQVSSLNMDLVRKMNESQRKESIIQHLSDASPLNPASTQREIEAFGRSLKPNNFFQQNYSLLNQMRAMKNVETDPSSRSLKRLKGPNNILLGEQVASKLEQPNESDGMVEEAAVSRSSVPSGDPKMLIFSGRDDYLERNAPSSQLGNVPSQDMLAFSQNETQSYSHGNSTDTFRIEQPKITPQMAPSWFSKYGNLKNGQMLQIYDAQKADTVKIVEQPFTLGKSSGSLHMLNSMEHVNAAADTNENGTWQSSISMSQAVEHFSPPQSLPPDKVGQPFVVLRPKKRKNATSELQSWHKEVLQGPQNLQTISMAETDWSKATNRLSEKVEDDASTIEYGLPMPRARRRLILTTQLMQQLFRAPPAVILSADASSNSEPVAYFVARLALGDACSLVSCLKSYSEAPPDGENFQADKCKTSYGIDDHHLSQVMEDFMGRARKLENDLLRLEKRSSVLDLRVEGQDLEKISVINRFAKFHGRGQADGAETLSSTDALIVQKPFPQKYVTAVPLPRNLPDRVQCLSL